MKLLMSGEVQLLLPSECLLSTSTIPSKRLIHLHLDVVNLFLSVFKWEAAINYLNAYILKYMYQENVCFGGCIFYVGEASL